MEGDRTDSEYKEVNQHDIEEMEEKIRSMLNTSSFHYVESDDDSQSDVSVIHYPTATTFQRSDVQKELKQRLYKIESAHQTEDEEFLSVRNDLISELDETDYLSIRNSGSEPESDIENVNLVLEAVKRKEMERKRMEQQNHLYQVHQISNKYGSKQQESIDKVTVRHSRAKEIQPNLLSVQCTSKHVLPVHQTPIEFRLAQLGPQEIPPALHHTNEVRQSEYLLDVASIEFESTDSSLDDDTQSVKEVTVQHNTAAVQQSTQQYINNKSPAEQQNVHNFTYNSPTQNVNFSDKEPKQNINSTFENVNEIFQETINTAQEEIQQNSAVVVLMQQDDKLQLEENNENQKLINAEKTLELDNQNVRKYLSLDEILESDEDSYDSDEHKCDDVSDGRRPKTAGSSTILTASDEEMMSDLKKNFKRYTDESESNLAKSKFSSKLERMFEDETFVNNEIEKLKTELWIVNKKLHDTKHFLENFNFREYEKELNKRKNTDPQEIMKKVTPEQLDKKLQEICKAINDIKANAKKNGGLGELIESLDGYSKVVRGGLNIKTNAARLAQEKVRKSQKLNNNEIKELIKSKTKNLELTPKALELLTSPSSTASNLKQVNKSPRKTIDNLLSMAKEKGFDENSIPDYFQEVLIPEYESKINKYN